VGTRFLCGGEVVEITELHTSPSGLQAVLRSVRTQHVQRMAVGKLLASDHVRILPDGAGPAELDPIDVPGVVLSNLTGCRSGDAETAIVEAVAHCGVGSTAPSASPTGRAGRPMQLTPVGFRVVAAVVVVVGRINEGDYQELVTCRRG